MEGRVTENDRGGRGIGVRRRYGSVEAARRMILVMVGKCIGRQW